MDSTAWIVVPASPRQKSTLGGELTVGDDVEGAYGCLTFEAAQDRAWKLFWHATKCGIYEVSYDDEHLQPAGRQTVRFARCRVLRKVEAGPCPCWWCANKIDEHRERIKNERQARFRHQADVAAGRIRSTS
jgi:hypothetical protein